MSVMRTLSVAILMLPWPSFFFFKQKTAYEIVKDLVGRGGVNGRVAVNNQTMGGDPAVGAEKHLRIRARNRKYGEREFDYREGGFVEVAKFTLPVLDRKSTRLNSSH